MGKIVEIGIANDGEIFPASFLERNSSILVHDGRSGSNRSTIGARQIDANDDISALAAWLGLVVNKKATFESYRKEVDRLLLWSVTQQRKPLSSLNHDDMSAYRSFLADPQPTSRWVMSGKKFPRSSEGWRPFSKPLMESSIAQSMTIINAMFNWLVKARYLDVNPLSLNSLRKEKEKPRVTRYLQDDLWGEVKRTIALMPESSAGGRNAQIRSRWLFSLLFICGLRISEVSNNAMGSFFARSDKSGQQLWWLEVIGKGNKTRLVPATVELMKELADYRLSLGMSPTPVPGEQTPLLLAANGSGKSILRSSIHRIVKDVFVMTSKRLAVESERLLDQSLDPILDEQARSELVHRAAWLQSNAERVAMASAHWIRHTAGSNMVNNGGSLVFARDNLGHESIATTSKYLHSDDDERHKGTEIKHRMNW